MNTAASEGEATGLARKSRLIEILSGQTLMSDAAAKAAHPNPPSTAPDHSKMLNAAEMRLLAEWIDTGGKYYNDPFDPTSGTAHRADAGRGQLHRLRLPDPREHLRRLPHGPRLAPTRPPARRRSTDNRFVLTGDPDGDWGVTMTMISDTCHPPVDYLLAKPSTIPHPDGATSQTDCGTARGQRELCDHRQLDRSGLPDSMKMPISKMTLPRGVRAGASPAPSSAPRCSPVAAAAATR